MSSDYGTLSGVDTDDFAVVGLDNGNETFPMSEASFMLLTVSILPADAVSGSAVKT